MRTLDNISTVLGARSPFQMFSSGSFPEGRVKLGVVNGRKPWRERRTTFKAWLLINRCYLPAAWRRQVVRKKLEIDGTCDRESHVLQGHTSKEDRDISQNAF